MAEDLVQLEEKAESLERKIDELERELRIAWGNVSALSAVIGLMADKYPENLVSQYIRECVSLGSRADLMKKETSALRYLSRIADGGMYEKLVALCAETDADPEPDFEMPDATAAKREPAGKRERAVAEAAANAGNAAGTEERADDGTAKAAGAADAK